MANSSKLSRRDYYLIPLLSLATVAVMFGAAEVGTRILYPYKEYDECRVTGATDPRRARPNCTVSAKVPEGPWVTYSMNSCGYRTPDSCGPKQPNVLRIALLGASMTMAKNVPLDESWGERTGHALAKISGHKVEVENLGWELLNPLNCYRQLNDVIALKPDLVVYAVNPFDLSRDPDPVQLEHRNDPVLPPHPPEPPPAPRDVKIIMRDAAKFLQNSVAGSRTMTMAQHFLFSNPDTFEKLYLADGDRADYLRLPFTPAWRTRFTGFETVINDMAERLHARGIPFVVIGLPARVQVILVMKGRPYPPGTDPYAFDHEIGNFCSRIGVPFLPTLDAFAKTPDGDKLFFVIDQHITGAGDAIIARLLVKKCMEGLMPSVAQPLSTRRQLLNEATLRAANESH
jgi:hypothetical protein